LRIDAIPRYHAIVKAVFVELPPFERYRSVYLDEDAYLRLQRLLILNPEAGNVIPGTGGLRKLRFPDERRGKGKRGGLRVIYYWWEAGSQFWLFTVYDKDEMSDLTKTQRLLLREMIKKELEARRKR
jgi:mRNA-degrading endonuclease RelE of RelBE toxin-antitoxin system